MSALAGLAAIGAALALRGLRSDHLQETRFHINDFDRSWNRLFAILRREDIPPGFFIGSEGRQTRVRSCQTIKRAIGDLKTDLSRITDEISWIEDVDDDAVNEVFKQRNDRRRSLNKLERFTIRECKGRPVRTKFVNLDKFAGPKEFFTPEERASIARSEAIMRGGSPKFRIVE